MKSKRREKTHERTDALAKARELRGSPLGNLLLEDAAASKMAGRVTARVGVGADGNPVVFSTDESTREAIVRSIQDRSRVDYYDIPEVSEQDFRKLLNEGVRQLSQGEPPRSAARVRACGKVHDGPCSMESIEDAEPLAAAEPAGPTDDAPFTVRIRSSERGPVVEQLGPFAIITQAIDAMRARGEPGQVAVVYDGSTVAQYRGDRARFRFGRSQWSRDT